MLWTAIALIQRTEPDVISVVYSGDTDATKDEIISKVKVSLVLPFAASTRTPASLTTGPIRHRPIVFKSTFRLSAQKAPRCGCYMAEIYAAGSEHWLDDPRLGSYVRARPGPLYWSVLSVEVSMKCQLTYLQIPWATRSHSTSSSCLGLYQSARMCTTRRSAQTCWHACDHVRRPTRTRTPSLHRIHSVKANFCTCAQCLLVEPSLSVVDRYYRLFMSLYAQALRQARFLMVNSSWTKNHVDSILQHHDVIFDTLALFNPLNILDCLNTRHTSPKTARIVYPPCDTREMATFALANRERIILSVAQFR